MDDVRELSAEQEATERRSAERGRTCGHGQAGFTLAALIVAIAIMSIFMGVAVQTVEFQMRREREAELIFRGQQYVEAIRLYKQKYGRNPMRLKEIWDAKPRVIRKKFKDPITDSDAWGVIFVGQEGRQITNPGGGAVPTGGPVFGGPGGIAGSDDDQTEDSQGGRGVRGGRSDPNRGPLGQGERIGPIAGVHSTSCDESIKIYEGRTSYCEWRFVLRDENQAGGPRGGGNPGGGGPGGGRAGGWHPGDPIPTMTPTDGGAGGGAGGGGSPYYGETALPRP